MRLLSFITLFLFTVTLNSQDIIETEIESSIDKVRVFFENAQIYRVKEASVSSGKSVLKFIELSPYIDSKSVQVRVMGDVTVLSVNHQQNFIKERKKSEQLKKLEKELILIQEKLDLENTYLGIINEEISFLQSNRVIGGKNQEVSVTTLKDVSEFYGSKLTELKLKDIEKRKSINKYNFEYQKIVKEITTITSKKEFATGEVMVTLESDSDEKITLELSYMVGNAGWFPSYDVRASSVDKPLELVYKANVHQDTKVSWDNVKLIFSSIDPNVSGVAPNLFPYLLNYNTRPPVYKSFFNTVSGRIVDMNGASVPGAIIQVVGTTIRTVSDYNGNYSITIPSRNHQLKYSMIGFKERQMGISGELLNVQLQEDVIALQEVQVVNYESEPMMDMINVSYSLCSPQMSGSYTVNSGISNSVANQPVYSTPIPIIQKENQTTVEFEIDIPYSIKSDSKNYVVVMTSYSVPAYYEYLSIPKIDKSAFLIANITNWEKYNLLDGEANLFFEDTYVGKSLLDLSSVEDTLSISLGRDKQVVVERIKVKDYTDRQFIGTKKVETRAWDISVKNSKAQDINIVILDQIPVPTIEEIELTVKSLSSGKHNATNGEVRWEFSLESMKKKKIGLKYSLKYPKNRNIVLD